MVQASIRSFNLRAPWDGVGKFTVKAQGAVLSDPCGRRFAMNTGRCGWLSRFLVDHRSPSHLKTPEVAAYFPRRQGITARGLADG